MQPKRIDYYVTDSGEKPFLGWISKLSPKIQQKIDRRIMKVAEGGSKKNVKALKDGTFEIKFDFGPGYRVYFGEKENVLILLLMGGDKSSQSKDILKAKKYWRNYAQKK